MKVYVFLSFRKIADIYKTLFARALKYENIYNAETCQKVYLEPSRVQYQNILC